MLSLILDREHDSWKEESLSIGADLFLIILFLYDECFGWKDDLAAPYCGISPISGINVVHLFCCLFVNPQKSIRRGIFGDEACLHLKNDYKMVQSTVDFHCLMNNPAHFIFD